MSPALRHRSDLTGSEVWEGDAREVAAAIPADSCSVAILDGPYALQKAAWDRMKVADLPEWYRPFLEDAGRVLAPSATMYVWGSDESEGLLRPLVRSLGWHFLCSIVWDKGVPANAMGWRCAGSWVKATERCGVWVRGESKVRLDGPVTTVWRINHKGYEKERLRTGRLVPPKSKQNGEAARYECGPVREALHPCQKPLIFAERMIRASSQPGEVVWVPFGGTLREAVAAERIARADPSEARRVITAELNQDGVDYIGPALRQMQGLGTIRADHKQGQLFGGAA